MLALFGGLDGKNSEFGARVEDVRKAVVVVEKRRYDLLMREAVTHTNNVNHWGGIIKRAVLLLMMAIVSSMVMIR